MRHSDENAGIMAEVASLYFEKQLSQKEIADRFYFSRSKVSRLLTRAVEEHIVEITVHYPMERIKALEAAVKEQFPLNHVIVIKSFDTSYHALLRMVGKAAALYIDENLQDNESIGITWGETVYSTIEAMEPARGKNLRVIQLMGATEDCHNSAYDSPELLRKMVEKYGGSYAQIYSPLVVENDIVRNSLMKEPLIYRVLKEAREAHMVLTSVGEFYNSRTRAWESHFTPSVKQGLEKAGTVGVLLAHFIRIDGALASPQLDKKVIGISLEELRRIKDVILAAGGEQKAKTVLGALRGGYINTLIVDETLAKKLLSYNQIL